MASSRKRSPEQQWVDGVVDIASKLHGSPKQVAEALLASAFFRMAEARGLIESDAPFEKRYVWLTECGGDASMLHALTPSFVEIPLDADSKHHIELLGHLHGVLMAPEERRGRGSHYTPREMAAQIVATTIEPLIMAYGDKAATIASLKVCDPAMGAGVFLVEAIRYLGSALHAACEREGKAMSMHDCRIAVAVRCIYGVDKDPTACWLAQSVVWLFLEEPTLSRYAFLHAFKTGDALVGLDADQLSAFHWDKGQPPIPEIVEHVTSRVHAAYELRQMFRTHKLTDDVALELNEQLDEVMSDVRLIGDLCIGAFFGNDKAKAREQERARRAGLVLTWLRSGALPPRELLGLQDEFTTKVQAFHWHFEFPEAFLWTKASLTPQPTEQPLVVSADARTVRAMENAHGQMGWAL